MSRQIPSVNGFNAVGRFSVRTVTLPEFLQVTAESTAVARHLIPAAFFIAVSAVSISFALM